MFVDDWAFPDKYEAELYEVENIKKMPVSLIMGENDQICSST